jgi:glutamate/aspartate transport system substrate-binding protein
MDRSGPLRAAAVHPRTTTTTMKSTFRRNRLACAMACALVQSMIGSAFAQSVSVQSSETLKRIAQTGTINLGHRESSVPFSYYDGKRQVIGYSHDLMLKVLEAIKTEVNLPALTIKLVPVTPQNRIPLVQNGTVDLECGSTSHNLDRERQVAFSVSIFIIGTRLLTARDSGIRDFGDLLDRKVVVTAGTTSERLLQTFNERNGRSLDIITARDHGESFQMLEAGRVQAFMMDDALLYGERAKAINSDKWIVVGTPMSSEVYACMMPFGDAGFKAVVDGALTALMQSGEALKLYARWFESPIPPNGLNLNWPPSAALLELYRAPNDKAR